MIQPGSAGGGGLPRSANARSLPFSMTCEKGRRRSVCPTERPGIRAVKNAEWGGRGSTGRQKQPSGHRTAAFRMPGSCASACCVQQQQCFLPVQQFILQEERSSRRQEINPPKNGARRRRERSAAVTGCACSGRAGRTTALIQPESVVFAGYALIENIDASPPDGGESKPVQVAPARQDWQSEFLLSVQYRTQVVSCRESNARDFANGET